MTGVRVREGTYEGRCDACSEWWPLTPEFWYARRSLRVCAACDRLRHAMTERQRRRDPAVRQAGNERQRVYRTEARVALRIASQEREARRRLADPTRIERQREYHRAATAAWRARQRGAA